MKYTKQLPKTDENLSNQLLIDGWKKIKEPSNLTLATLLSIPFMLFCSIIFLSLIFYINPDFKNLFRISDSIRFTIQINLKTLLFLAGIYLFTLLHELIHAIFIPNALKLDKIYFGVRLLYGFVYTTEKISKFRFIIVSIMPFIILSIIFPILLNAFGLLNNYILFLCLLNALGSSVDFLNIFLILTQVPNKSYLIINGFETYFKN
ncbi:Protein of uncharacterised function (DUF3267) [[Clostridium] sordellii]|uniref:Protein of uncharacterized function (DUF3267) n=1 Tax=Paraclostridium sordellii TaxID=1505 RepID=A0A0C7QQ75_PARSO|nr:DUF3267 domain-containing protein [Paeniclostridium sordellii]CEQ02887.1 Protein of uncharacterised function (DUF3267) [[Clostridium] sordellii] [Paeniclostridium sordellii]